MTFDIAPVIAGIMGYRCEGWVGAIVYPISAVALWALVPIACLIGVGWIRYQLDSARISRLSDNDLCEIILQPCGNDFRFAFFELQKRGDNVKAALESLLRMLDSDSARDRRVALARLQEFFRRFKKKLILRWWIAPKSCAVVLSS